MNTNIIISITTLLLSSSAFCADAPVSVENRRKMAELHQKMSDCLKTEKPMSECHNEMMQGCDMMGKNACPMMGPMHGKMYQLKKKAAKE
jgi:hypothetical protein